MAPSLGIFALAVGLVCGLLLEMIILGLTLKRQGFFLLPKWYGFDQHLRQVSGQYTPMIAGAFLMSSTTLVDQAMAAMLSSGSVAALNYGYRVIAFPISLAMTALGTAVIPYFSKMVAHQDWGKIRHTLQRYLSLTFVFSIPITGCIILFSKSIIQWLFQRGNFTEGDTYLVSEIQVLFALQIPFIIGSILLVRLISSLQINQVLMWGALLNLISNITLNYLFMKKIGVAGIALSTSCVMMISFFFLLSNCFYFSRKIIKRDV
jgi:putative peptidoglycan lipid II flippase